MPKVTIEQSTFERLQQYAEPFVDTPDSVITRALDALAQMESDTLPDQTSERQIASADWMLLNADDPLPDLKHTRMLAAAIDSRPVRANWNNVLRRLLVLALDEMGSLDEVRRRSTVNLVASKKEDEGYQYLAEAGISYQGVNANAAANAAVALAKDIGAALELDFEWRYKPQALYPGKRAQLRLSGSPRRS